MELTEKIPRAPSLRWKRLPTFILGTCICLALVVTYANFSEEFSSGSRSVVFISGRSYEYGPQIEGSLDWANGTRQSRPREDPNKRPSTIAHSLARESATELGNLKSHSLPVTSALEQASSPNPSLLSGALSPSPTVLPLPAHLASSPSPTRLFELTSGKELQPSSSVFLRGKEFSSRCYDISNPFCCQGSQKLCSFRLVCYNGRNFIRFKKPCMDDNVEVSKDSFLLPMQCNSSVDRDFRAATRMLAGKDNKNLKFQLRDTKWLQDRQGIKWHNGSSYFLFLDNSENNVAHFIRKVNHLLLFNNATTQGFTTNVDRVVILRTPIFKSIVGNYGPSGFHAQLLSTLLRMTFPLLGDQNLSGRASSKHDEMAALLPDPTPSLNTSHLLFETSLAGATEQAPFCFQRAIFSGNLKASAYPGGFRMAHQLHQQLLNSIHAADPPESSSSSRLLYIQRKPGRQKKRFFDPKSEASLMRMFSQLGFEVTVVDFGAMSFRDQFMAVRSADVIIGLHGAGLTNAAAFCRPTAVVIEIQPYKVEHIIFEGMSLSNGATYMQHQCHKGELQDGDERFAKFSRAKCQKTLECRQYFVQSRRVELTEGDGSSLKRLLEMAKAITESSPDARNAGLEEHKKRLQGVYDHACIQLKGGVDLSCRLSMIHSGVLFPEKRCIIEEDCSL